MPASSSHGIKAARQATQVGAHRQAAVAYEQVLARGDLLDATRRGRLREGYAWALSNTNRLDAAAAEAAAAVSEYESAGELARLVRPLVTLSRQQWLTERTADARASAERALRVECGDAQQLGPRRGQPRWTAGAGRRGGSRVGRTWRQGSPSP